MSTSSFKTGLDCKHCSRHSPDSTVAKQWGENRGNDLISVPNLALKVNGVFVCCKCGTQIGTDDDKELPVKVGELVGLLIQQCHFQVEAVTDQDVGQPFIWLSNRALPGARCQVRWFRDTRWVEGEADRHTSFKALDFDVSELRSRPPAVIEQTLRLLTNGPMLLTEMPKNDAGYAYLAAVVENYGTRMEPLPDPKDFDPDNPRTPENTDCPLIVQVHLQWKDAVKV